MKPQNKLYYVIITSPNGEKIRVNGGDPFLTEGEAQASIMGFVDGICCTAGEDEPLKEWKAEIFIKENPFIKALKIGIAAKKDKHEA